MTDFPTALTIIQRKADPEELWRVLHDTVEECEMLPCRFQEGEWTRYTWTDGERRVVSLRLADDWQPYDTYDFEPWPWPWPTFQAEKEAWE